MTFFHGVGTVAAQEFRVRLRAGRWRILLTAWFIILVLFTGLVALAFSMGGSEDDDLGVAMFGIVVLFVNALLLLVVPSLTAQSVNGDRERGTLATLQVTLLTPLHIAAGKLLAAWAVALVFLLLALPAVIFTMVLGGTSLTRFMVVIVVDALLLGVYCAIAQGLSALLARSTTSSVLSYIAVFTLTIGTLIAFALTFTLVPSKTYYPTQAQVDTYNARLKTTEGYDPAYSRDSLAQTDSGARYTWWLIAINPFAIIGDSAPALPLVRNQYSGELEEPSGDVLGSLGTTVRLARPSTDPSNFDYLTDPTKDPNSEALINANERKAPAIWPWGLGINLLIAGLFFTFTVRRLRTPVAQLSRGQRIA